MKLVNYLAALAVAAVAAVGFAVYADGDMTETTTATNLVAGWNNYDNPNVDGKTPADFGWVCLQSDGVTAAIKMGVYDEGYTTRFRASGAAKRANDLFLHFQNSNATYFAYPISDVEANTTYLVSFDYCRNGSDSNLNSQFLFGVNSQPNNAGTSYYSEVHYTGVNETWINVQYAFTTGDTLEDNYYVTLAKAEDNSYHLPFSNFSVTKVDIPAASNENPVDVSYYIKNPSLEEGYNTVSSWTNSGMDKQNNTSFSLKDQNYYVEKWSQNTGAETYQTGSLKQTVTLPQGHYKLNVNAFNTDQANSSKEPAGVWVYAGDKEQLVGDVAEYTIDFNVYTDNSSVEIGFKAENSSGNYIGVDNFKLYYLGEPVVSSDEYNALLEKAKAALASEDYANVTGTERTELQAAVDAEVSEYTVAVLESLTAKYTAFTAAKESYDSYASYKVNAKEVDAGLEDKYSLATAAKKEALTTLLEAPTTAAEAATNAPLLYAAYRQVIESNAVAEGVEGVTSVDLGSWTNSQIDSYALNNISSASGEGFTKGDGTAVNSYSDAWKSGAWANNYNQSLTLTSGKYRLSVFARAQSTAVETYQLYAGDESVDLSKIGSTGNLYGNGWDLTYVDFEVEKKQDVTLGIKIITSASAWVSFNDFNLVKISEGTEFEVAYSVNVKDEDGNAVEGATVTLSNEDIEPATTNAEGVATFTVSSLLVDGLQATISADEHITKTVALAWDGNDTYSFDVTLPSYYSNLMENALEGTTHNWPVNWTLYTREGKAVADYTHTNYDDLRDSSGTMGGNGDPYQFFIRWDNGDFDRYYTYEVEIPVTGVYDLNFSYTQNGARDDSNGQNPGSHVGASNRLQVEFTNHTGYNMDDSQVWYLTSESNHADFYATNDGDFRIFAEAGKHYLSFVGSRALWRVKDFSLKLSKELTMSAQPESSMDLSGNVYNEDDEILGNHVVKANEGATVQYIWVKDGDESIQTYADWADDAVYSEAGTLYAYEVAENGVHGKVWTHVIEGITAPELSDLGEDEYFFDLGSDLKWGPDSEGKALIATDIYAASATIHLNVPEGFQVWWKYAEKEEVKAEDSEGEETENAGSSELTPNTEDGSDEAVETKSVRLKDEAVEGDSEESGDEDLDLGEEEEGEDGDGTDEPSEEDAYTPVKNDAGYTLYDAEYGIVLKKEGELSYYVTVSGVDSTERIISVGGVAVSVKNIMIDGAEGEASFYNLNGVRVSADRLTPGIYIVRQGSKTMKIVVK